MKNLYLTILSVLTAGFLSAQTVDITFQVNMNDQTVGSNGVHVAGGFQAAAGFPGDWDPATSALTDGNSDGIYELTVTLPQNDTFEYKFVNGNAWGSDESVPGACSVNNNRQLITGTANATTPDVCFGMCIPCPTNVDTFDVTFMVDMSMETVDAAGVHLVGGFGAAGLPNWDPAGISMTDADNDDVYEATITIWQGTWPFKFVNGDAWGKDESAIPSSCTSGGNREMILTGNGDTISDSGLTESFLAAFNNCPPTDTVHVTFRVNMANETADDTVSVAGTIQSYAGNSDWSPGQTVLDDSDGDGIYEITIPLPEGSYAYKFVNGSSWGFEEGIPPACRDNGNRGYTAMSNGDAFSDILYDTLTFCFGECTPTCPAILPAVDVTFRVDLVTAGVTPAGSGLYVAGDWQNPAWVKDTAEMTSLGNGVYEYTSSIVPGAYEYLYFNGDRGDLDAETTDFTVGGCGIANAVGGFNRFMDLNGLLTDTVLPAFVWNTCDASTVGLQEKLNDGSWFTVYPNPFNEFTTIEFENADESINIQLFDLTGKMVRSVNPASNFLFRLDRDGLPSGVYFLNVSTENNGSKVTKLIVE